MSVTRAKLNDCIVEAQRFIEKVNLAMTRLATDSSAEFGCKETGAVKRASMDLSRMLSDLRSSKQ